jgi:hypothetical protein
MDDPFLYNLNIDTFAAAVKKYCIEKITRILLDALDGVMLAVSPVAAV